MGTVLSDIELLPKTKSTAKELKALSVHNGWAGFVVFLLADPHLLEGGERSQDGATDPDGILAFWRSNDLDLHGGGSQGCDLLLHTVSDARVHGAASGQNCVGIQVFTDVHVTLHDAVVGGFVDTTGFHSQEGWLENGLRTPEPLVANGDDLAVGKLVALLQGRGGSSGGHLLLEVESHIAQLLLDVTDDLPLGSGGEAVATLGQDLHEVVCQISASQIQTQDGVGQGVTLVDGHGVGDTISGVEYDTSGTTGSVQRQDSLNSYVHGGGVERLEHDL